MRPWWSACMGSSSRISPTSTNYINPMDLNLDYSDDESPLSLKSDFILSLCELIVGGKEGLQPVQKTIIDRCVRLVYQTYLNDPPPGKYAHPGGPLQPVAGAGGKRGTVHRHGAGNLCDRLPHVFNHQSNVDINNRIVCYDIQRIGASSSKRSVCWWSRTKCGTALPSTVPPQVHPLLHRRDAPAAERGADRRLYRRDLEAFPASGAAFPPASRRMSKTF